MSQPSSSSLIVVLTSRASTYSTSTYLIAIFALLAFLCVLTRLVTGIQFSLVTKGKVPGENKVAVHPYWIPLVGHARAFFTQFQPFLGRISNQVQDGCFGLNLFHYRVNVASVPSIASQVLNVHAPVNNHATTLHFFEAVMGDGGTVKRLDQEIVWGPIHRALFQMNREPFVSNAVKRTVGLVEREIFNLIDFDCKHHNQLWERTGEIQILSSEEQIAEASLYPLLRDFVGNLTLPALMGSRFAANNPDALSDLWALDSHNDLLLTNMPRFLHRFFPSLPHAIAARKRLGAAVAEFEEALLEIDNGSPPTERWGSMSDVSKVLIDRAKGWRSINAPRIAYGAADASIIWAVMANVNHVIFWLVWHIYSDKTGLIDQIRAEISPFVSTATGDAEPRLQIDVDALMTKCPLLQSTFLETMRMNAFSAQFKKIHHTFAVTESVTDAKILGKLSPHTYKLNEGEMVVVPNGAHQMDERYWNDAGSFDPRRFWVRRDDGGKENVGLEYGTMKVWGGGATQCKGQKVAEREVAVFIAAIVSLWDIRPVGGEWVHPGKKAGTGSVQPKREVRVEMRKRGI